MAKPRIIYDGNNLDFPNLASMLDLPRMRKAVVLFGDGGIHSTAQKTKFLEGVLTLENFQSINFERELHGWWSWARRGEVYSIALDLDEVGDTTLDGAAAAAQKVIPLTATAGLTVGQQYRIYEIAGGAEELVTIDTISAGVSVTLIDNLVFPFASGDIFRARDFVPKVVNLDNREPWTRKKGVTFGFKHKFREDDS